MQCHYWCQKFDELSIAFAARRSHKIALQVKFVKIAQQVTRLNRKHPCTCPVSFDMQICWTNSCVHLNIYHWQINIPVSLCVYLVISSSWYLLKWSFSLQFKSVFFSPCDRRCWMCVRCVTASVRWVCVRSTRIEPTHCRSSGKLSSTSSMMSVLPQHCQILSCTRLCVLYKISLSECGS